MGYKHVKLAHVWESWKQVNVDGFDNMGHTAGSLYEIRGVIIRTREWFLTATTRSWLRNYYSAPSEESRMRYFKRFYKERGKLPPITADFRQTLLKVCLTEPIKCGHVKADTIMTRCIWNWKRDNALNLCGTMCRLSIDIIAQWCI